MPKQEPDHCEICEKDLPLTFHHLIPKKCHSNKWFRKRYTREEMNTRGIHVCRKCHNYIHEIAGQKELGRDYNTLEALLQNEKIASYRLYAMRRSN